MESVVINKEICLKRGEFKRTLDIVASGLMKFLKNYTLKIIQGYVTSEETKEPI